MLPHATHVYAVGFVTGPRFELFVLLMFFPGISVGNIVIEFIKYMIFSFTKMLSMYGCCMMLPSVSRILKLDHGTNISDTSRLRSKELFGFASVG